MFSMYNPLWTQFIVDKPPTVYSLLESIVNYGNDDKTKIKDLAKAGRTTFFNFNYPLTDKISREDFECMILNNFIDRRIGYETLTTFRIKLNVKLNEIMPTYNKMFEMLDGWDIFQDGEQTTRVVSDTRNINSSVTNQASTNTTTNSQTSTSNTKDIRKSDTPQNELEDVRDGSYVTDYEYNTNNSQGTDSSSNTGTSSSSNSSQSTNTGNLQETVNKSPSDKLKIYTEFIEKRQHIYSMIFEELDCLFYQLV